MMKFFWEQVHKQNNKRFLTGSSGLEVLRNLDVSLTPTCKVLNIGVGEGHCTREFSKITPFVDVLDISEIALDSVDGSANKRFLEEEIDLIPQLEYDFALSHLVTQHMSDSSLNRQLKYVIAALKEDGVFAMQFAFDKGEPMPDSLEQRCQQGLMVRTLEEMKTFVKNNGGVVTYIKDISIDSQWKLGWYCIHIMKEQNE
jgi:cyclopropane fatty-acyl-phospholipid synthase-like methyltransferase